MLFPEDQDHLSKLLDQEILEMSPLYGGDINRVIRLKLTSGKDAVLKMNASAPEGMFEAEFKGLSLLNTHFTLGKSPKPFTFGRFPSGRGDFLLLEYLPHQTSLKPCTSKLGHALANMHLYTRQAQFGLDHNNYIGRLPQPNTLHKRWIDFFIQERIHPQLKLGIKSGYFTAAQLHQMEVMAKALPDIMPDEPASLLHGDLWSGNVLCGLEDEPMIIDPAVYYGHREIELAFTRLFGGFSTEFYKSYEEAYPLEKGFESRIEVYNLYPLLVHANLFGGGYVQQVLAVLNRFR